MKVIGAGLPRTATLSQHAAMEILGFTPVYHMATLFELEQGGAWRAVLDGKRAAAELLDGYEATVDWPGSYYTKDLVEAFPEAKVVLSERPPEAWANSMVKTIWALFYADNLMRHLSDARACIDPGWRAYLEMMKDMWHGAGLFDDGRNTTPQHLAEAFTRRNDELKAELPAERLLVWSARDGWEPLCEFLEVPVPDEPFPQINDSGHFTEWMIAPALERIAEYRAAESRELEGAAVAGH
jgi:Sulfotransferase domain